MILIIKCYSIIVAGSWCTKKVKNKLKQSCSTWNVFSSPKQVDDPFVGGEGRGWIATDTSC